MSIFCLAGCGLRRTKNGEAMDSAREYIETAIRIQLELNRSTNLFFKDFPANAKISPELINRINARGIMGPEEKESLVEYAVRRTEQLLYEHNQYIAISDGKRRALKELYQETLRVTEQKEVGETLIRSHQKKLARWLKGLYTDKHIDALQYSEQIGKVTCAEYSPELIESVYRIDLCRVNEPILDIGCGKNGYVVQRLRSLGKDVIGFDRSIDQSSDGLEIGDWLAYEFFPDRWGSIFANMSFSNHFIYHLMQKTGAADSYRSTYRRICDALRVGGSFYYAPALPAEEKLLCKEYYMVENVSLSNVAASVVTRLQ